MKESIELLTEAMQKNIPEEEVNNLKMDLPTLITDWAHITAKKALITAPVIKDRPCLKHRIF